MKRKIIKIAGQTIPVSWRKESMKKIRKSLLVPGYAVRLRDISKNKPQKQLSYERKTNKNNRTDIAQRL
jgi:hypothetical protein